MDVEICSGIFDRKIRQIISTYDETEQNNFLKMYPIFKNNWKRLIDYWQEIYINICFRMENENDPDINNILIIERKNAVRFLMSAFLNNCIEYESKDVFKLLNLLTEYKENNELINLLKINILNGRSKLNLTKHNDNEYNDNTKLMKNINEYDPKSIALELTRQTSMFMKNVTSHELLYFIINDGNKQQENKFININNIINQFNKMSYVLPSTLLIKDKDNKMRAKTIRHVIKICYELSELNNYQDLFAFLLGLNHTSIKKLNNLWTNKTEINNLIKIINCTHNYNNYRNKLKKLKEPLLPYIGIIISDIKHLLENGVYDIDKKDINWDVFRKCLDIMNDFEKVSKNYKIDQNPIIANWIITSIVCTDDESLYNISKTLDQDEYHPLLSNNIDLLTKSNNDLLNNQDNSDDINAIIEIDNNIPKDLNMLLHKSSNKIKHRSMPVKTNQWDKIYLPEVDKNNFEIDTSNLEKIQINEWTLDDVSIWLKSINMEEYVDLFKKEEITGECLNELTELHLKKELNINKLGHRLKILKSINDYRDKTFFLNNISSSASTASITD